jgi:hypothetical protein
MTTTVEPGSPVLEAPIFIRPTIGAIKAEVARRSKVPVWELDSDRRHKDLVRARQIAMTIAKRVTRNSLPMIGKSFGRDHTTVLHAVRKIEAEMASSQTLAREIEAIEEAVASRGQREAQAAAGAAPSAAIAAIAQEVAKQLRQEQTAAGNLLAAVRRLEDVRYSAFEMRAIEDVIAAGRALRKAQGGGE